MGCIDCSERIHPLALPSYPNIGFSGSKNSRWRQLVSQALVREQFLLLALCLSYLQSFYYKTVFLLFCTLGLATFLFHPLLSLFSQAFILAQLSLQIRFIFCDVCIFLLEIIYVFASFTNASNSADLNFILRFPLHSLWWKGSSAQTPHCKWSLHLQLLGQFLSVNHLQNALKPSV